MLFVRQKNRLRQIRVIFCETAKHHDKNFQTADCFFSPHRPARLSQFRRVGKFWLKSLLIRGCSDFFDRAVRRFRSSVQNPEIYSQIRQLHRLFSPTDLFSASEIQSFQVRRQSIRFADSEPFPKRRVLFPHRQSAYKPRTKHRKRGRVQTLPQDFFYLFRRPIRAVRLLFDNFAPRLRCRRYSLRIACPARRRVSDTRRRVRAVIRVAFCFV